MAKDDSFECRLRREEGAAMTTEVLGLLIEEDVRRCVTLATVIETMTVGRDVQTCGLDPDQCDALADLAGELRERIGRIKEKALPVERTTDAV